MRRAKVSRSKDWPGCGRAGKGPGLVCTFLGAAAMFGVLALLRGQDPAPAPSPDASLLESRLKSGSIFPPSSPDYVISPDDLLDVSVFDVPEISRAYQVSPSGSISLALLPGPISAAGLTLGQLARVLSERLRTAGLVRNPQVTVEVKQSRVHSVAIAGAVKRPQIYPLLGKTTLLDALSQAEGLADDAGNTAIITRGEIATRLLGQDEGREVQADDPPRPPHLVTVDLKRLLEDGDSRLNLDLYAGDWVTVQRAGIVYVVGAVNRSGGYALKNDREEMTVLKAIALAENVKSTAIGKKAMIVRKNPQIPGGREEIAVDLDKILSGHAPDRLLLANDILFVPDSTGKKALRRAAEAAVQVTTGVIIWRR